MKVTIKELTIESDSDFSHVNIDFSKGSIEYTTTHATDNTTDKTTEPVKSKDVKPVKVKEPEQMLDLDADFSQKDEEPVEKPTIDNTDREVHVSDDMMKLEF